MLPTYTTYGFASAFPRPQALSGDAPSFYSQGYYAALQGMPGAWRPRASEHETSPWAWQWSRETRAQEGPFTHHSYPATIVQPRVQPAYGVEPVLSAFSRIPRGPVSNTNRLEVICPRPIYPLPKWVDMVAWEEDGDEGRSDLSPSSADNHNDTIWEREEGYGEELVAARQFLPLFLLSPDPEDLPAPFSPPSPCTLDSLSPDACELPQPRFGSGPYPPIPAINSRPSASGVIPPPPSWYDPLEPIVFPNPEDIPPPNFGSYSRLEVDVFERPEPLDRQDRVDERGTRDHTGRGSGEDLWKVWMGGGRGVSGHRHRDRWHDFTWAR